MKQSIFRAYDIRGTVHTEFIIAEVEPLARAIAYFFSTHYPQIHSIAIGADGRIDSPEIKKRVIAALLSSGYDLVDIGMCTSPLLYYTLHTMPIDAGIMITASHNGKRDNGLKINIGRRAVSSEEIQQIGRYYQEKRCITQPDRPAQLHTGEMQGSYCMFLKKQFPNLVGASFHLLIDCGNGAAGPIMQKLCSEFQWKNISFLYPEVDGNFPHHDPNPAVEKNMEDIRTKLRSEQYACGVGLDGDADRIAVMTRQLRFVQGDELFTLFAASILKKNRKAIFFCNVLTSNILIEFLQSHGAYVHMIPVGSPTMRKSIIDQQGIFGGETSGHYFFNDHYFGFDDGIYALLRLIEIFVMEEIDLDQFLATLPRRFSSSECRMPCSPDRAHDILKTAKNYFSGIGNAHCLMMDGIRVTLPGGWLIIRSSNTQPVLSIRFEGRTKEEYGHLQAHLLQILPAELHQTFLKESGVKLL